MEKKVVIFLSNDQGASVLWAPVPIKVPIKDENGLTKLVTQYVETKILEFKSLNDNLVSTATGVQRVGQSKWACVKQANTEEELAVIEVIRKHPHYGVQFYETNSMPAPAKVLSLRESIGQKDTTDAIVKEALELQKRQLEEEKKVTVQKMKRYAELSAIVQKNGGDIVANADTALVEEFNNLKQELGIENEKNID
jgi:hypothetical protein